MAPRIFTERAPEDRRTRRRRVHTIVVLVDRRVEERRRPADRRVTVRVGSPVTADRVRALPRRSAAGTV